MELRDLETFGEPGAVVYLSDCLDLMRLMPAGSVDAVFADPPYRLSNGGVTVKNGRVDSVDKGTWDRSLGSFERDHEFNERWMTEARRVLKPGGTIWVSGTHHVIFSIGFALQTLGFRIINSVAWEKPDPPPNALHTAFTHPKAVAVRIRFRLIVGPYSGRSLGQHHVGVAPAPGLAVGGRPAAGGEV